MHLPKAEICIIDCHIPANWPEWLRADRQRLMLTASFIMSSAVVMMRVAADFNRPGFGEGLARLKQAQPALVDKDMVERLASTRALAGLDRLAAALPDHQLALIDKDALQELAASGELSELAAPGATLSAARLATLQKAKEKPAPRKRVTAGGRRKDKEK